MNLYRPITHGVRNAILGIFQIKSLYVWRNKNSFFFFFLFQLSLRQRERAKKKSSSLCELKNSLRAALKHFIDKKLLLQSLSFHLKSVSLLQSGLFNVSPNSPASLDVEKLSSRFRLQLWGKKKIQWLLK